MFIDFRESLLPKLQNPCHCNKLEVDLTQENVISVALWIHLGPGSGTPSVTMV